MQASMQLCHFVFWSVPAAAVAVAAVDIHIDDAVVYSIYQHSTVLIEQKACKKYSICLP
jgi:hypothetical protein